MRGKFYLIVFLKEEMMQNDITRERRLWITLSLSWWVHDSFRVGTTEERGKILKRKVKLVNKTYWWWCFSCKVMFKSCDHMDWNWPGSSVSWDFPGKKARVGCHFLLQRIFPTQGSNPGLLHCRNSLPSEPPGKGGGICSDM